MSIAVSQVAPVQKGLTLGIDLGSSSLGTALVDHRTKEITFLGVRVFAAGEGALDEGKEGSRAAKRRAARLARRQTQRRHRRLYKVFRLLQRTGLLPEGPRVQVLHRLQSELERRYPGTTVLPWFLRAQALDRRLEPCELGRALYHLAQRRGFVSNRLAEKRENPEERGKVKSAIKGLDASITAAGKRTLGEYMASLNPREVPLRNKPEFFGHYTHRSMFEHEFQLIWESQQRFYPELLTEHRRAKLFNAMFHQRPLRDQTHLVGACELETAEKRAPLWLLAAQRFRVLSAVNNLRLRLEDGSERKLTLREREALLELCEKSEKLTFVAARRALGLKTLKFTIEEGGEKNVPVNLTSARLRSVLGTFWDDLSPEQKEDLVEDVGGSKRCKTDEEVARCARDKWGLAADAAERLAQVRLPDGYGRYSLKALRELLPMMEEGLNVEEAVRRHPAYSETRKRVEPLLLLPPVKNFLGDIRNPAILRSLTELRKTVNAIIRRYGKPEFIHVELARDLKKSKKERQLESGRMQERKKIRDLAKEELKKHDGVRWAHPKSGDIEKYLLAMEAKWRCPYTGREYGFTDVFGEHPSVDMEHIIPRSRSLDDSFLNKTLTYRSTNIEKGNRTPREWLFQSDPQRYENMVRIVREFDARFEVGKKLKRFTMDLCEPDSLLREFTERQLQDTRYASKLACRYLGALYGGVYDESGTRVFACAGQVTAKLRDAWDLSSILNPDRKPQKSRDDHRHHAVDALVVALSSRSLVRALANAAGDADRAFRRKIILAVPWDNFAEQARTKIESLNVSHRPIRRLSGPLHEETLYSKPRKRLGDSEGSRKKGQADHKEYVHYRIPITECKDYGRIVDCRVRSAVQAKANELGGGLTRFLNNWPVLVTRKGDAVPIKRVRIRKVESVVQIGRNGNERYVAAASNHHAEIVANVDGTGRVKRYDCKAVTMLEAVERKRQGVRVVQREHGPGFEFVCTLSEGDLIEAAKGGVRQIWRIRTVRKNGQLTLASALDARLKKESDLWSPTVPSLFKAGARKVTVTHLGEVIPAND